MAWYEDPLQFTVVVFSIIAVSMLLYKLLKLIGLR